MDRKSQLSQLLVDDCSNAPTKHAHCITAVSLPVQLQLLYMYHCFVITITT
jgi:hypothetical protein